MLKTNFILIAIAGLLALAVAFYQYIYKNKEKSKLEYALFLLRFLTLFLVGVFLVNPKFLKKKYHTKKPTLAVVVDNSASIKALNNSKYVISVVNQFKNSKKLQDKFKVQFFKFGSQLQLLDTLVFTENHSDISNSLHEIAKLYKNNTATVLITDGNITKGTNPSNILIKNAVYPLVVGDTTKQEDIFISKINVNKQVFINNKFPVEVFVTYNGVDDTTKKVAVFHDKNKIAQKTITLNRVENSKSLSFNLKAKTKGTQYYSIRVETLEKERNKKNNSKSFSINVLDEVIKVGIISHLNHPDLGVFKNVLATNKKFKIDFLKVKNKKIQLNNYQLVILYQPNKEFKFLFDEINTKKINYLVVTGLKTNWGFLNKSQPLLVKEAITKTEEIQPKLNLSYAPYLVKSIDFSGYSPVEDIFGETKFNKLPNILLYQKIKGIPTKKPLLASISTSNQKVGMFFGENVWKWRIEHFRKNNSFEGFDTFFASFIHYLSSNSKKQRLSVAVKSSFYANESVDFGALFLGENLSFDARASIQVVISKDKKQISKQPFYLEKNRYKCSISNLPSGTYFYEVLVNKTAISKSGSFKVLPYNLEEQFTHSNYYNLELLAKKTKGKTYYKNNEKALILKLINAKEFKSLQSKTIKKIPLINEKWALFLVLFLLTLEWFLRKYFGKI